MVIILLCKICNKDLGNSYLGNHIKNIHKISYKEYYDSYLKSDNEGFCKICKKETEFINLSNGYKSYCEEHIPKEKQISMTCKICNIPLDSCRKLSKHLKYIHNLTSKEYYDTYIEPNTEHKCICGNETLFLSLDKGYQKHCSVKCAMNDENVKEQTRQTNIEKYNKPVANCFGSDTFKENMNRIYGVEHNMKDETLKERNLSSTINKHGGLGMASEETASKITKTKEERYGDPTYTNREKAKQTTLEHLGVENPWQAESVKEQIKETMLERHGVDNIFKDPEVHTKAIENAQSSEAKEKRKETMKEKYDVEYYTQSEEMKEKSTKTKEKNQEIIDTLDTDDL